MAEKPVSDGSSNHVEEAVVVEDKLPAETLKLDPHGFPLMPQPSNYKDDPLVSVFLSYSCSSLPLHSFADRG